MTFKPYRLGNGTANICKSLSEKQKIVDYLFNSIDLSNYRFQMLKNLEQLDFLKENEHFVSPNFYGINYLMIFMKLNNQNKTFMIDRRKLKYSKEHIDVKTLLILQVDFSAESSLYNGTIIDGKLMKTDNNYYYICNDFYQLFGNSIISQKLDLKYETINKIISTQMSSKPCFNFEFKINKLYNYEELDNLINNIIPKTKLPINGIVFYPQYSGTILIFSDKQNSNNKNTNNNDKQITNFKTNKTANDESYHIVRDLCKYLESRVDISEDNFTNEKKKHLFLKKTDTPDVYYLLENEDSPQIGIAHIPNLKLSHKLDIIFKDIDIKKFKCVYNKQFKKWMPIIN